MKNKFLLGVFALLSVFTLSLTSCDDDDDVKTANVQITNTELGEENSKEALIGGDLHIEASIQSEAKIKLIELQIKQSNGSGLIYQQYNEKGYANKYVGVLNTVFHEHLDIAKDFTPGKYHFTLTVTDVNGAKKTWEEDITFIAPDPNAPIVTFEPAAESGKAGSKLKIKATVTVKNPIDEIELVFHGDKGEFPQDIEDYKGKTGTVNIEKEITIPANAPAGEYHIHFTVKDSKGLKTTGEFEGFNITE